MNKIMTNIKKRYVSEHDFEAILDDLGKTYVDFNPFIQEIKKYVKKYNTWSKDDMLYFTIRRWYEYVYLLRNPKKKLDNQSVFYTCPHYSCSKCRIALARPETPKYYYEVPAQIHHFRNVLNYRERNCIYIAYCLKYTSWSPFIVELDYSDYILEYSENKHENKIIIPPIGGVPIFFTI